MNNSEAWTVAYTVPELRAMIKELAPDQPTSKLRKAELVGVLIFLRHQRAAADEQQATEAVDQVITEELSDTYVPTTADLANVASAAGQAAEALHAISPAVRSAAKALAQVAWGHQRATVRSMGRTVHGKVVDTVLRDPGPDGMGRVCVVVQHIEQGELDRFGKLVWTPSPYPRRTLHRYLDVQFTPLTS